LAQSRKDFPLTHRVFQKKGVEKALNVANVKSWQIFSFQRQQLHTYSTHILTPNCVGGVENEEENFEDKNHILLKLYIQSIFRIVFLIYLGKLFKYAI
jgi:hypothetical protein